MSELLIFVFILALWHVILFFGHNLGISVVLFMVPLLIYQYRVLSKNKKIKNWYGLLLSVPIVLLSLHYVLFNNNTFNVLNYIVILFLLLLMFVLTVKPTYKFNEIFFDFVKFIYRPFNYIGEFYKEHFKKTFKKIKLSDKGNRLLKTLLIILPIVCIILLLLSKADPLFKELFRVIIDAIVNIFKFEFIDKLLGKIFMFIIMTFVIGISTMYLIKDYGNEKYKVKESKFKDIYTIKVLVTVLNVIYLIFDFIQVKSLFSFGSINCNHCVDYASYARSGFFELLVVSLINMTIILISKKYKTDKSNTKYMNIMNIVMIFLTMIIIVSSFIRMHFYEVAYGYTVLRLLVDVVLITEVLLMIPTVMYIINSNFNISKSFLIIIISMYCCVSLINVDYLIASKNINRYYNGSDLDIKYLETYTTDNIPLLINLYKNTDDSDIKFELRNYFEIVYKNNKINSWEEFNFSKYRAIKQLEDLGL